MHIYVQATISRQEAYRKLLAKIRAGKPATLTAGKPSKLTADRPTRITAGKL